MSSVCIASTIVWLEGGDCESILFSSCLGLSDRVILRGDKASVNGRWSWEGVLCPPLSPVTSIWDQTVSAILNSHPVSSPSSFTVPPGALSLLYETMRFLKFVSVNIVVQFVGSPIFLF